MADVCRATSIASATLDRYYYDRVKSFDRDVLAGLCLYLEVKPGELLIAVDQGDLFEQTEVPAGGETDLEPETLKTGRFGRWPPAALEAGIPRHARTPGKKKGPGDYPSPSIWWSRRESNPRPQALYSKIYIPSPVVWF